MINFQPARFKSAWDICIKVPLVIKNATPFGLRVRTYEIADYSS